MTQIIIDYRERKLIELCENLIKTNDKFKSFAIKSENLLLGDIIIRDEKNQDLIIIERKSIDDLVSSIKDGRYEEQSHRLNSLQHHKHNIIYLIEGNISAKYNQNKQMIFSAMFSLNYYKGFSVFRSISIEESAFFILNSCLKLSKEKDKKPFYNNTRDEDIIYEYIEIDELTGTEIIVDPPDEPEVKSYCNFVQSKKNSNITPENIGEIMLIQIPGINSLTAVNIMKEFKTINNLINQIRLDPDILLSLSYITDKNKTRKLNKTVISNILKFLNQ